MSALRSNHRRRWVVNRPFQIRFIRAFLLIILGVSLLILGGVYVALWWTLSTFELEHDPITVQLFKNIGLFVSLELLVAAPLLIWMLTWMGIFFTHKIVGPLVRIMASLQQMARGDFDVHLRLRKADALVELAEAINLLAAFLRGRA